VPATAAVASRIFSAILLARETRAAGFLPELVRDSSPFVSWDGQWYLHIARYGYHAAAVQPGGVAGGHHDFAFYPGWPLLIRLISLNGILPLDQVAVVLANLLFVLAAVTAFHLFADRFDERTALWGTLLLCFNPVAYVFSMAYTESLFVLLVALYFVDRYRKGAPLFAGAATLVRVSGLAIGVSAAAMLLIDRGRRVRAAAVAAAVALAFGAWWLYIWRLTGNFFGWFLGSPDWQRDQGIPAIGKEYALHQSWEIVWIAFVALMIVGSVLLIRRHADMAVYGLVTIGLTLVGAPAWSMPRHAMVAFPAFAAIASRLGPRLSAVLVVVFMVGEFVFVDLAFGPGRNPP